MLWTEFHAWSTASFLQRETPLDILRIVAPPIRHAHTCGVSEVCNRTEIGLTGCTERDEEEQQVGIETRVRCGKSVPV